MGFFFMMTGEQAKRGLDNFVPSLGGRCTCTHREGHHPGGGKCTGAFLLAGQRGFKKCPCGKYDPLEE